jgi:hypothetical protein
LIERYTTYILHDLADCIENIKRNVCINLNKISFKNKFIIQGKNNSFVGSALTGCSNNSWQWVAWVGFWFLLQKLEHSL